MQMAFSYKDVIKGKLATSCANIFDALMLEFSTYQGRSVSGMDALKYRDNKKIIGRIWEELCKDYLLSTEKYVAVYLLSDIPADISTKYNITSRIDNGIDIIALTTTGAVAIQCKYRSKGVTVKWKELSTFFGLCERTGPWEEHIVMTNCKSVNRCGVPKGNKDRSMCVGTFRNIKRHQWEKIVGNYTEYRLSDDKQKKLTLEELRNIRIERFQ